MLIGDEPDSGMENLMEVEIPDDVQQKLEELDAKEQEQIKKEEQELTAEAEKDQVKSQSSEGLKRWWNWLHQFFFF